MGEVQDRVRDARRQVMLEAFERWVERWRGRERKRNIVAIHGPGAPDSLQHNAAFRAREAQRRALGLATERMIGGGWEPTFFAPSDGARSAARPVARLVEWGGDGYQPQGLATGFLVSPDLILTNWHVIPERSCAEGLYANFGHERTERGTAAGSLFALQPDRFFTANERLDFALVAVAPDGPNAALLRNVPPIRLIGTTGKIRTGDPMHVIQHPGGGPRQYAVQNNRLVDVLDAGFLHYESDTLQGSSGSPVFNTHWELVALHHCGVPAMRGTEILRRDGNPWNPDADDEEDVDWVANEGARVSFIVAALREARLESAEEQRLLQQLLATVTDPLAPGTTTSQPAPAEGAGRLPSVALSTTSAEPGMSANIFNISGGTVTIHVGAPPTTTAQPATAVVATETGPAVPRFVEKAQNFNPDYTARPGYDPGFLGVEIPLPQAPAHHTDLYSVANYKAFADSTRNVPRLDLDGLRDDDALVLRYHHYSLVMNRVRRMAMFTASNVDYSEEARQDPRKREDFGGESWRLDPRVPKEYQLVNAEIYAPARNLDRGHLVRREDSAWGAPGLDTEFSNADTYHWTNCTPQHELFNQENPDGPEYVGRKGIWGEFEGHLQAALTNGGGQATIFAGPVLYNDTRTEDFGRGEVIYPLKFWKVVVVPDSRARRPRLAAYGFVFDQSRAIQEFGLGVETLELRRFARQAKPLREIEALSGVQLPDNVREADRYA
jgi:endonuclease G